MLTYVEIKLLVFIIKHKFNSCKSMGNYVLCKVILVSLCARKTANTPEVWRSRPFPPLRCTGYVNPTSPYFRLSWLLVDTFSNPSISCGWRPGCGTIYLEKCHTTWQHRRGLDGEWIYMKTTHVTYIIKPLGILLAFEIVHKHTCKETRKHT